MFAYQRFVKLCKLSSGEILFFFVLVDSLLALTFWFLGFIVGLFSFTTGHQESLVKFTDSGRLNRANVVPAFPRQIRSS